MIKGAGTKFIKASLIYLIITNIIGFFILDLLVEDSPTDLSKEITIQVSERIIHSIIFGSIILLIFGVIYNSEMNYQINNNKDVFLFINTGLYIYFFAMVISFFHIEDIYIRVLLLGVYPMAIMLGIFLSIYDLIPGYLGIKRNKQRQLDNIFKLSRDEKEILLYIYRIKPMIESNPSSLGNIYSIFKEKHEKDHIKEYLRNIARYGYIVIKDEKFEKDDSFGIPNTFSLNSIRKELGFSIHSDFILLFIKEHMKIVAIVAIVIISYILGIKYDFIKDFIDMIK